MFLNREEVERDREVVRERELTTLSEVKRFAHPHVMQNYVFGIFLRKNKKKTILTFFFMFLLSIVALA